MEGLWGSGGPAAQLNGAGARDGDAGRCGGGGLVASGAGGGGGGCFELLSARVEVFANTTASRKAPAGRTSFSAQKTLKDRRAPAT